MALPSLATRYVFFTGKGGVGKTSLACASALALAERGQRVLLVSTDPASNLDEVLETPLSTVPTPVASVPGLFALNVDPEAAAAAYRERMVAPYRGVLPAASTDAQALPGRGVQAVVDGATVYLGNQALMAELGIEVAAAGAQTASWLARAVANEPAQLLGMLAFGDAVRPSAQAAVARLRALDIRCVMLTGDNAGVAAAVAAAVGIEDVHAGVLPGAKRDVIEALKRGGARVGIRASLVAPTA